MKRLTRGEEAVTSQFPSSPQAENDFSPAIAPNGCVPCWISFGGNVGEVRATFDAALALLSLHCDIQLGPRSGLYCSTPMGAQAGNRFLNSICGLTTQLTPYDLLSVLQSVETQLGRVRKIDWGPRTLDLDLLSYGDIVIEEPHLVVPHPALTYRRFVLDPLVEIDPAWEHPVVGESAARMLERLKARPLTVALLNFVEDPDDPICHTLKQRFPDLQIVSEAEPSDRVLPIQVNSKLPISGSKSVDLRRSPGDLLEQLTAAFTAIFDTPTKVSDW